MSIRNCPSIQTIVGPSGRVDPHWERWFGDLAREVNDASSSTEAPAAEYPSFVINGAGSVTAEGAVAAGEFVVTLTGDDDNPPPNSFYGADTGGNKGFVPLYSGLEEGQGIALRDSGYVIVDTVATPEDLPLTGNAGEAVRVTDAESGLYAWDGSAFTLDAAATGVVSVTCDATAAEIPYDNATSGLTATDVQAAVDELTARGGGGYGEGAAFPGSPVADTKFYRTDLQLLCYYDGTRWLTVQEYVFDAYPEKLIPLSANGTTSWMAPPAIAGSIGGCYLTRWQVSTRQLTPKTAGDYWTVALNWYDAATVATALTSFTTASDTASAGTPHNVAINAVLSSSAVILIPAVTKTGTPGNLFLYGSLHYRLIVV